MFGVMTINWELVGRMEFIWAFFEVFGRLFGFLSSSFGGLNLKSVGDFLTNYLTRTV